MPPESKDPNARKVIPRPMRNAITKLVWLNTVNGAHKLIDKYAIECIRQFEAPVFIEMGCAYGGAIEHVASLFKKYGGKAYGFDTFEGHPKHLAENNEERDCMDGWYRHEDMGVDKLQYDYQRNVLDELGLDNAILIKGEINDTTKLPDGLNKIHFAFLDLDIRNCMVNAYNLVKDRIVRDGYLLMHDASSNTHLVKNWEFVRDTIKTDEKWQYIGEWTRELTIAFKKL